MVPQDQPESPQIIFTAVALFDRLTWSGLRRFVDLAEREGVDGSQPVDLHFENDDYYSPLGLSVTFAPRDAS